MIQLLNYRKLGPNQPKSDPQWCRLSTREQKNCGLSFWWSWVRLKDAHMTAQSHCNSAELDSKMLQHSSESLWQSAEFDSKMLQHSSESLWQSAEFDSKMLQHSSESLWQSAEFDSKMLQDSSESLWQRGAWLHCQKRWAMNDCKYLSKVAKFAKFAKFLLFLTRRTEKTLYNLETVY